MAHEPVSIKHCLGLGARLGGLWLILFLAVPVVFRSADFVVSAPGIVVAIIAFCAFVAGVPAAQKIEYRNRRAVFFLLLGAVLTVVPLLVTGALLVLSALGARYHG